jgi:hypothetical protein
MYGDKVTDSQYRAAKWFADVWTKHCHPGMHLRAVHYKLLSVGGVTMAAGVRPHEGRGRPAADPVHDNICLPPENTQHCWERLLMGSSAARLYEMVDARHFQERRSPQPRINATNRETPTPRVVVPAMWLWRESEDCPLPTVVGYDYAPADQPRLSLCLKTFCGRSMWRPSLTPIKHGVR